jgi:hypothetical protein
LKKITGTNSNLVRTNQLRKQQMISQRVLVNYDSNQLRRIKARSRTFFNDVEVLEIDQPSSKIRHNQTIIGKQVVNSFKNKSIVNVMVIAQTQSGKTGSMCSTIFEYLSDPLNLIPIENIYIITGLSSIEWKEQTMDRMPESIKNNVYHRNELLQRENLKKNVKNFGNDIKGKKNVLIIMDEIQIAAMKGQTIYKMFEEIGLLDIESLYKNDIKILEYTATPDGTIYDLMKWNDASDKILASPGEGYVSCNNLLEAGRVKQFNDLHCPPLHQYIEKEYKEMFREDNTLADLYHKTFEELDEFIEDKVNVSIIKKKDIENVKEIVSKHIKKIVSLNTFENFNEKCSYYVNSLYKILSNIRELSDTIKKNYKEPLYHIIRTGKGVKQENTIRHFKKIFGSENFEYKCYDGGSEIQDINKLLKIKPMKHTVLFIKEMLRCAFTLHKKYNGIMYERFCLKPNDSSIIQGLIGRDTGYNNNSVSICYTNIPSLLKYEKMWKSNFNDTTIEWNSKTTQMKNGTLTGKNTFNDLKEFGISDSSDDDDKVVIEPYIKYCNNQEEGKDYYRNTFIKYKNSCHTGRGPNTRKADDDGFYHATIRGTKKVFSVEQMYKERRCNIQNGAGYGFRPCYRDVTKKETIEWWFIHYK